MSEEIYISEEVNALVNEHYKPQSAHGIMVCERWARAIQLLLNQQIQLACLNWRHRDAALQTKIAALEAEVEKALKVKFYAVNLEKELDSLRTQNRELREVLLRELNYWENYTPNMVACPARHVDGINKALALQPEK